MSHFTSEEFSEITSEDQYPEAVNLCSTSQWKQNWKCGILTCLICSCLLSVLYWHRQLSNQVNLNQDNGLNKNMCWMLVFCAVVLYSLYLMECSYATDNMQLCTRNTENIEQVKEKIERMKNSEPVIWWKATCYHYARRKRRITQYRRGTYFVSTKVYQERVNSFTSSSTFNFSCCGVTDISNNLILDETTRPIVKFNFSKGFAFANMASAIEFEEQRSMFFRELRRYDDYMDIHEGLDLTDCSNFEEEVLAINTMSGKQPWFANPFYYWLCSCCLLSWPFRVVLLHNTVNVNFKVTKLFGSNYNNLTESTQQLALLQLYGSYSVDSVDNDETPNTPEWYDIGPLDGSSANLDPTTTLVPSYSEALLFLDDSSTVDNDGHQECDTAMQLDPAPIKDVVAPAMSTTDHRPSPSRISLLRTPKTPKCSKNVTATRPGEVEAVRAVVSADEPPTYEEALMFPVVEHPNHTNGDSCGILRAANSAQATGQMHFQNESRLSNTTSRTFLSIETSL